MLARNRNDADASETARAVRDAAEPLPGLDEPEAFGALFDRFAEARVVLLGEATHGTSEFYRARAAVTRRLIEAHGFAIVAVEADWPDAARLDAYARGRPVPADGDDAFTRFPAWMWRNAEVYDFVDWLRGFNAGRPAGERVQFRGLDIYSLNASIAAVLAYLDRVDPEEAQDARRRYGCLSPWQADPARYGRAVLSGDKKPCDEALLRQLRELMDRRAEYMTADPEAYLDAVQNARVARAAERYYRIMYQGSADSWNLRDRHMFDTLRGLLARDDRAKAVVWAHNSHIGDATATAMGWEGELNIGELCRKAFGRDAVLIGFATDRGEVAAASDWDAPMQVMRVRPARDDSWERVFREAGRARSLTAWRNEPALRAALSGSRLERAIGVVYRPESELHSHYFEAVLADQFDALVWFEETSAVTPLGHGRGEGEGEPETYPFGL